MQFQCRICQGQLISDHPISRLPAYFNLFLSFRLDGKEVAVKCTDAWKYADMVATLQHEAAIYGKLVL